MMPMVTAAMTVKRAWHLGWLLAAGLLIGGCSGKLPALGPPTNCGDQCASTTCPPDTHCALTGNCTPLCSPDPLPSR
jgi:hypothetical protein